MATSLIVLAASLPGIAKFLPLSVSISQYTVIFFLPSGHTIIRILYAKLSHINSRGNPIKDTVKWVHFVLWNLIQFIEGNLSPSDFSEGNGWHELPFFMSTFGYNLFLKGTFNLRINKEAFLYLKWVFDNSLVWNLICEMNLETWNSFKDLRVWGECLPSVNTIGCIPRKSTNSGIQVQSEHTHLSYLPFLCDDFLLLLVVFVSVVVAVTIVLVVVLPLTVVVIVLVAVSVFAVATPWFVAQLVASMGGPLGNFVVWRGRVFFLSIVRCIPVVAFHRLHLLLGNSRDVFLD